jgi:cell division protein ZipA
MLDVAQDLVGSLDAELRDDQRNIMSAQTIEHYRQRVRDFELQRLRARAAAG